MKRNTRMLFLFSFCCYELFTQNFIKGYVKDEITEHCLKNVFIGIKNTEIKTETSVTGLFVLKEIPKGKQMLVIRKEGYETQNYQIELKGNDINLGDIFLYKDELTNDQEDLGVIIITDDELNDDTSTADNISGLLQSSRDLFLRTAAFDWSSSYFKLRGLDSENGKVLINGIEMNKLYNGRPQWSNWGGLNDVTRNQEFSRYLTSSSYTFGGVLGTTQIDTRASAYKKGNRIVYSSSNRSYLHRLMATYASGVLKNNWSFVFSASKRLAKQGFIEGTSYNAYSLFGGAEKKINKQHSINFTSIYASNRRGKSGANTEEIYNLKGIQYNPYWGYQNGEIRNSRIKEVNEPILMLNHYWNISKVTSLTTGFAYQFGGVGNSRLDYSGSYIIDDVIDANGNPVIHKLSAVNPDPTYWQKLPSYALSKGLDAYAYQQAFLNDGQIDWKAMYNANSIIANNSAFILYEDRNEDRRFSFNSTVESQLTNNITLNASLQIVNQTSENFAEVLDLLRGNGYLDVNPFSEEYYTKQNNLLNENFVAKKGDKVKYHYAITSQVYNGFAQVQCKLNTVDFFASVNAIQTSHQRNGLFENGRFPGSESFGKSEKKQFFNISAKGGCTYKIDGRNIIDFNGGYLSKAPYIKNIFFNARENNHTVPNIANEKILSGDVNYILRHPILQAKATAYYTSIKDATDISFFYTSGGIDDFLQEILTGVDKQHIGTELAIELKTTNNLKFKAAANIGQYAYANNPNLYIASEDFQLDLGSATLKNYKLSSGPQKVYSIGFEYRDPDYWWFSATANLFNHTYVDVSSITRTNAFYFDEIISNENIEGFQTPIYSDFISDYDESTARKFLKQERFDDYMVVNLVGGKSWKIKGNKYIGFFASVGNLLNRKHKTGGYEQGRLSNYNALLEDASLETKIFGNKYWYGRGTSYFFNINYRF